jgi:hypothetical protein
MLKIHGLAMAAPLAFALACRLARAQIAQAETLARTTAIPFIR